MVATLDIFNRYNLLLVVRKTLYVLKEKNTLFLINSIQM